MLKQLCYLKNIFVETIIKEQFRLDTPILYHSVQYHNPAYICVPAYSLDADFHAIMANL